MGQRGADTSPVAGEQRPINSDLWHACAGPLVSLPSVGSLVVYFPQGHSEQVAASMQKGANAHIPSYPNLPSKLICLLHSVNLHADAETDEVYAQMTLQPVNTHDEKALLASDISRKPNKTQPDFFCKTLTASDTSTHGGFSVPRRAAEKIFPPLDFSMQPPCQEIHARDLHDNLWIFRHIFRGQPKRHLLTTGWSLFVSGKRLFAGDSVLFIRDEKQEFLLGIRRANRQPTNISSSVLSSDSMHIGVLAAAAHAAANHSPFTVFYNPRTTSSEFVIPLAKYQKALYNNQISLGMRFRMMFETEDSGTRRYMGTITGINDLDPTRWKNSQWRNLQVAWDESATGERRNRVSIWEIEPVAAPFFIYPPPFFGTKRPRQPGISDDEASEMENLFKSAMPWLGEEICIKDSQTQNTMMPGLSLVQWMDMQQNFSLANLNMQQPDYSRQLGMQRNIQFNAPQQTQQLQKKLNAGIQQWQQPGDQRVTLNQNQAHMKTQIVVPTQVQQQQQEQHQQQKLLNQHQTQQSQQNRMTVHLTNPADQQQQISENQIQLQLLRKLQHQQQSILSQCAQLPQTQEKQRTLLDSSEHLTNPNLLIQQQPTMSSSQQKLQEQQVLPSTPTKIFSTTGSSPVAVTGPQSGPTDDFPSCSTSPSTNNSAVLPQQTVKGTNHSQKETKMVPSPDIAEFPNPEQSVNDSTRVHMMQRDGVVPGTYIKNIAQLDYLDSSSSATSVCVSQNNGTMQHTLPFASLNKTLMFRDAPPDFELQETGVNLDNSLGIPLTTNFLLENLIDLGKYQNNISGNVINDYSTSKEAQQELASSMVSQSYGIPNMGFNPIGSTINESGLLNKSSWAAPPQFQRMRTYTKVYKRGAVGRSIDISHYSGYDELRRDLARMFSIEGQLEDPHKIRWKLVYVDHEGDVLLVGDDPWEEFVNCVRCIRILSPQEVQQINREGDLESSIIPEHACSSWNGGSALTGQCEQNWGNPSAAGSYNSLE